MGESTKERIISTLNYARAMRVRIPKVPCNFATPESILSPTSDNPQARTKTVSSHPLQRNSYFNLGPLHLKHYKKLHHIQILHTIQLKAFSQEAANAPKAA